MKKLLRDATKRAKRHGWWANGTTGGGHYIFTNGQDSVTVSCSPKNAEHVLSNFEKDMRRHHRRHIGPLHTDTGPTPSPKPQPARAMPVAANTQKPKEVNVTKAAPPAGEISFAMQVRIANELQEAFDEKAGAYLPGESDESVGKRVGQAWGIVKRVRERLGFEIKVSPEVLRLQQQQAKTSAELEELLSRVDALMDRVKQDGERLKLLTGESVRRGAAG